MNRGVDRERLAALLARERATFAARHPESARAYQQAGSLFGRVPMTWMNMAAGGFPLYLDRARGARVRHPPANSPWAREMEVEDSDGHVLRFGSEPRADLPSEAWSN